MLRYTTDRARPGLVALYDIRPGNGAGQFLQPRSPHGAPATEARSGALSQAGRAGSANTRHPAGRPAAHAATDRMYATDVRQTDVRQHHRLMLPG